MTKSFALAFAALTLSAGVALASPAVAPLTGTAAAQNGIQTAQAVAMPITQAQGAPAFDANRSVPVTTSISAAQAPAGTGIALQNGVSSLVNETGGGR